MRLRVRNSRFRASRRRRLRSLRRRKVSAAARLQFLAEMRRARLTPAPLGLWRDQRKLARMLDELINFPLEWPADNHA